jgi:hypothetical protein
VLLVWLAACTAGDAVGWSEDGNDVSSGGDGAKDECILGERLNPRFLRRRMRG